MVLAGELLRKTAEKSGAKIIPVDSEHSAVDQCLRSGQRGEVRRLILTASGGPFRETPVEQFARHHSGTGAEASDLADGKTNYDRFGDADEQGARSDRGTLAFRHPVRKRSTSWCIRNRSCIRWWNLWTVRSVAQLGTADMRQPIQYALTYPERLTSPVAPLDWAAVSRLDFCPPGSAKVSMHRFGLRGHPNGRHGSRGPECRR